MMCRHQHADVAADHLFGAVAEEEQGCGQHQRHPEPEEALPTQTPFAPPPLHVDKADKKQADAPDNKPLYHLNRQELIAEGIFQGEDEHKAEAA